MTKSFKIKIYNWDWTISFVPKQSPHLYLNDYECYGVCDLENFTIYICSTDISKELIRSTITHELVHALLTVSGLRKVGDTYAEEDICEFVQWHGVEIMKLTNDIYKKGFK